jgi:PAS domain S-box-containing protein
MSRIESGVADNKIEIGPGLRRQLLDLHDTHDTKRPWQLFDLLPAAVYVTDADGRMTYFNDAAASLWGCRPKLHSDQWCGSWRLYHPDGRPMPHDQCPMAVCLRRGEPIRGAEAIAERPDGSRVPFMAFPTPLRDAAGNLVGAVNMLIDIGEHRRAERIERRLSAIVESSDDAIVSKDLDGVIVTWNKAAERLFGYLAEEVIGKSITILIPADRQEEERDILDRIRRGERVDHFETLRQRKDGSLVNISLCVSPISDEFGKIVGASKIARDITHQKRREELIDLLAREAEHRAKNLLAVAQATVHLAQGDSPAAVKAAIEGRLRALASAHTLLAQSRWAGADLHTLVVEELAPHTRADESRVETLGENVMLKPDQAQAMAVALHELATNAVKYGALSVAAGCVKIEWGLRPGNRLSVRWVETGGPPVLPPGRNGFGMQVMARMIRDQLGGKIDFDWRPQGIICDIAMPL